MVDPSKFRDGLDEREDEARFQRMWSEVEAGTVGGKPRSVAPRRLQLLALASAAALLLGLGLYGGGLSALLGMGGESTRTIAVGPLTLQALNSQAQPLAGVLDNRQNYRLSDDSQIELSDATSLEVLSNDGHQLGLALRRGRARFEVTPGGPRRWSITCGPTRVEVVGTVFTLERRGDELEVSVERGTVVVSGALVPDGAVRLETGGSLSVTSDEPEPARPDVQPSEAPLAASGPPASGPPASGPPASETSESASRGRVERHASSDVAPSQPPPAWRDTMDTEGHQAAFQQLQPAGVRRESVNAQDAESLMALADVARLSGHSALAIDPLRRVIEAFPTGPQAPLAAYTSGQIQLQVLADPAAAQASFSSALRLGITGALADTARARRIEAMHQVDPSAASRQARQYLERYPQGHYRHQVERYLEQPAEAAGP